MEKTITIYDDNYVVEASNRYNYNKTQPVLEIFDSDTGMPCGVISVCIPGADLKPRETVIKPIDRQDLVATLVEAGVALDSGRCVYSGYGEYPVVELTQEFFEMFESAEH